MCSWKQQLGRCNIRQRFGIARSSGGRVGIIATQRTDIEIPGLKGVPDFVKAAKALPHPRIAGPEPHYEPAGLGGERGRALHPLDSDITDPSRGSYDFEGDRRAFIEVVD
jgi:hypothetical protein